MRSLIRTFLLACLALSFSGGSAWAAKKAIATLRGKGKKTTAKVTVQTANRGSTAAKQKKSNDLKAKQRKVKRLLAKARRHYSQYKQTLAQLNRALKDLGKGAGITVQGKKNCNPKCQQRRFRRMQRKLKRLAKKNGWNL